MTPPVVSLPARRGSARAAAVPSGGTRAELGQFFTPPGVAAFMASLFHRLEGSLRVLDAGAGVGALVAAFAAEACRRRSIPARLRAVAYEVDAVLAGQLRATAAACRDACRRAGIPFEAEILERDFIDSAVELLDGGASSPEPPEGFTHAILNPPYRKLSSGSAARRALRRVGIETSNLYAAFLALSVRLLAPGGEFVAITPRSFCNGPYFRSFRELLLREMALRRLHVFESRTAAFADDEVLQENIIVHAVKGRAQKKVVVSSSSGPEDPMPAVREVPFRDVVRPGDPELFIHLAPDQADQEIAELVARLPARLGDLGLSVSTGRVVDFRARPFLRSAPEPGAGPLIYPTHFSAGVVRWPKPGKKPNALADVPATQPLWMPEGTYVLVKRFSSKEEPRRIVAAVFDPALVPAPRVGFENHLNVFHAGGAGLTPPIARGLAAFLNATLVDAYFRQFNGHTQVNATDLRSLRYPPLPALERLGAAVGDRRLGQDELDRLVGEVLLGGDARPAQARRKRDEALAMLKALGLPKRAQSERSALTLLALVGLKPETPWSEASAPLLGLAPLLSFIRDHYGKLYVSSAREAGRRQAVHPLLDAGLMVANPDAPSRSLSSPKAVYQIEAKALARLRALAAP